MGMDLVTCEQAVTSLLVDSGIPEEKIPDVVLDLEAIIRKYDLKTFEKLDTIVGLLMWWRD